MSTRDLCLKFSRIQRMFHMNCF